MENVSGKVAPYVGSLFASPQQKEALQALTGAESAGEMCLANTWTRVKFPSAHKKRLLTAVMGVSMVRYPYKCNSGTQISVVTNSCLN